MCGLFTARFALNKKFSVCKGISTFVLYMCGPTKRLPSLIDSVLNDPAMFALSFCNFSHAKAPFTTSRVSYTYALYLLEIL